MAHFRTLPPLFAVASLGLLGACSTVAPGDSTELPTSNGVVDLELADSPLADYYGFVGLLDEAGIERQRKQERDYQDALAQCMAEKGFDYTPNLSGLEYAASFDGLANLDPLEYAEQVGYGISQSLSFEPLPDPNAEATARMSEAELAAWDAALNGVEVDDNEGAESERERIGGCYSDVSSVVYAYDEASDPNANPQFRELLKEFAVIVESVEETPRMAALNAAWAECMAQAGEPDLTQPWDAQTRAQEFMASFVPNGTANSDVPEFSADDVQAIWEFERAIAVADATCQTELDYADISLDIRFELEQDFLDERGPELKALMDTYGGN